MSSDHGADATDPVETGGGDGVETGRTDGVETGRTDGVETGGGDGVDDGASACGYTEYVDGEAPESFPKTGAGATGVEADVWDVLYEIEDPEMPVSIVDLGLIYGVGVEEGHVRVQMTLTYSGCPARNYLKSDILEAVSDVDGVDGVDLDLVWSPPWNMDMVTDQGRADLREFGLSV